MNNSEILSELKAFKDDLMLLRTSLFLRTDGEHYFSSDEDREYFDPFIASIYMESCFWDKKPEARIEKIEQEIRERISKNKKK